jgi:pimeloyl-ACP methyl ester carboxylesterase
MTRITIIATVLITLLAALAPGAGASPSTRVWYKGKRIELAHKYRKSGRELVLFIHGLACSSASFEGAWDEPALDKYSLLAVDLPGFGGSSRPVNFSYTLEDHAGVVYEMLRKFPQKKVHIVGHSMGGAVAVFLAKKNPRRFASLMNVDGCLGSQNGNTQQQISPPTFDEFTKKLEKRIIAAQGKPEEKGLRLWYDWSRASDPTGFSRSDESLIQWARSGKLFDMFLGLRVKKAYFYPERDGLPGSLRGVKSVRKIEVPKTGHFIMNDNPGDFYRKLAEEMAR